MAAWLILMLACTDKGGDDSGAGDGGTDGGADGGTGSQGPHNVLVIIADDLGVEASACYPDQGVPRAPQPNIQRLCGRGVVFDSAWSSPVCSPTRAGMLTGRQAWRHGVGEAVSEDEPLALDEGERTLPLALALGGSGHAAAHVGKWHLGRDLTGPNTMGWPHFAGPLLGEVSDYYSYEKVVDGETVTVNDYATTETVDDALAFIAEQEGPWVLWVAFNAPHSPLHLPPEDLHSQVGLTGTGDDIDARPAAYFQAMVEAMDTELGRLLDGLGEDPLATTHVIYVADNGTDATVNQDWVPADHAKASLYEGGVHVPLVIAGPAVVEEDRRVSTPVSTIDLFATVLELAGASTEATAGVELDSTSLVPLLADPDAGTLHDTLLTEIFGARTRADEQGRALREARYKLLDFQDRGEELYDLEADPLEEAELLSAGALEAEAQAAYEALATGMAALPALPSE